jgi:glycopeptide antibiotics resistance protein
MRAGFWATYLEPVGAGVQVFAVLALVLALPYLLLVRRIEGGLPPRRLLVAVLVLLYVVLAWAQVLLPFPQDEICLVRHVDAQLVPFRWVADAQRYSGGSLAELALSPPIVVRALNVLLLIPLGVLLRRWWGRGFGTTVAIGLLVSLAFELTQWTGVWGVVECAYRTFDVDDLVANTAGAALGWWLAPLARVIPDRSRRVADAPSGDGGRASLAR